MVKKHPESILSKKCFRKIMLFFGIISLLVMQNSFQGLAASGFDVYKSTVNQQKNVTGRVIDAKNIPLVGVNIVEKSTNNGVISDLDGKFSIAVSSTSAVLSFSSIGY